LHIIDFSFLFALSPLFPRHVLQFPLFVSNSTSWNHPYSSYQNNPQDQQYHL
jgi:hypothetical protein